jgi:hypothetical protein
MNLSRFTVVCVSLAAFCLSPLAWAEESGSATWTQVDTLSGEAVAAFEAYSFRKGRRKLNQALRLVEDAGLGQDKKTAQIYMFLGVAAVAGSNDLYRGVHAFVKGLRLDPTATPSKALLTPQIQQVFGQATQVLKAVGKPAVVELPKPKQISSEVAIKVNKKLRGLVHDSVDQARPGYPIPIKAQAGADIRVSKMFLFFRSAGKVDYQEVELKRVGGLFRGEIPKKALSGRYIHYYIQARDPRGRLAASHGGARGPNVVIIR